MFSLDKFLYGGGSRAVLKLDVEAHKKYGEHGVRSSRVIDFDDDKIVGVIETVDGKKHRMTVRNWKKKVDK